MADETFSLLWYVVKFIIVKVIITRCYFAESLLNCISYKFGEKNILEKSKELKGLRDLYSIVPLWLIFIIKLKSKKQGWYTQVIPDADVSLNVQNVTPSRRFEKTSKVLTFVNDHDWDLNIKSWTFIY